MNRNSLKQDRKEKMVTIDDLVKAGKVPVSKEKA
jgi:hypothetical protein